MFSDSFKKLEHGTAASLLDLINPKLEISGFDTASAQIMSLSLPFYKEINLVEISDPQSVPAKKIFCLHHKTSNEILILNGKNDPIYKINKKFGIQLDDNNVSLYARFFFSYVRGRHGIFHLINNVSEIKWREEPTKAGKQSLNKMISPVSILSYDDEDGWVLISSIIFKDSLFETEIHVKPDGTIRLGGQEILVEDIPVLDNNFDIAS